MMIETVYNHLFKFASGSGIRHLEYRVRLQYIKLSPEKIRKILLSIQATIFYNTKTNKKYVISSKISQDAKKIYKLMEVPMKTSAYKL